jgi:4-amino-4-deoxychorismate lyase
MSETCIETIKALDGKIYNIDYHQKRYERTLTYYYGLVNAVYDLKEFLKPPKDGLYRCRVVYSHKGILDVSYYKYKKRAINKLKIVYDDEITYKYKSTNRDMLDKLYAQRGDADDVIIIKDGYVTDTTIANIAFKTNGVWYTPKQPLLKGTTRQRLLDAGKLQERKIKHINSYTDIALLNSMIDFDIITNKQRKIKDIVC